MYLLQAFGYKSVAFNGYECMKYETIVYYCIYRKISIIAYEILVCIVNYDCFFIRTVYCPGSGHELLSASVI